MVELLEPTTTLRAAWSASHDEWGPGLHEDGFGLTGEDEVASDAGFDRWVTRLLADATTTYRWLVEHGQVLGGIALRHRLDEGALEIGQLGYGIRPTARGRGLAAWAVGQMLALARGALELGHVMVVCAAENTASVRVIEHHHDTALGPARRYRMTTADIPRRPGKQL